MKKLNHAWVRNLSLVLALVSATGCFENRGVRSGSDGLQKSGFGGGGGIIAPVQNGGGTNPPGQNGGGTNPPGQNGGGTNPPGQTYFPLVIPFTVVTATFYQDPVELAKAEHTCKFHFFTSAGAFKKTVNVQLDITSQGQGVNAQGQVTSTTVSFGRIKDTWADTTKSDFSGIFDDAQRAIPADLVDRFRVKIEPGAKVLCDILTPIDGASTSQTVGMITASAYVATPPRTAGFYIPPLPADPMNASTQCGWISRSGQNYFGPECKWSRHAVGVSVLPASFGLSGCRDTLGRPVPGWQCNYRSWVQYTPTEKAELEISTYDFYSPTELSTPPVTAGRTTTSGQVIQRLGLRVLNTEAGRPSPANGYSSEELRFIQDATGFLRR